MECSVWIAGGVGAKRRTVSLALRAKCQLSGLVVSMPVGRR
jgi:hypothetical protein